MATTAAYMEYVMERLAAFGDWHCRKLFGEYMAYRSGKPLLLMCDNTVFVKKLPELAVLMEQAGCGLPYEGAKEHYVLDLENTVLLERVLPLLEAATPLPKPRKKKV